jgi:hypothetical protein
LFKAKKGISLKEEKKEEEKKKEEKSGSVSQTTKI